VAYVFDSTAALALFLDEPGADQVIGLLDRIEAGRSELLLPFMTFMEVRYRLLRIGEDEAATGIEVMQAWRATTFESTPAWGAAAARLKARGGLSLADAWIASLALLHDAQLVHSDPEFDRVEGLRSYPLR